MILQWTLVMLIVVSTTIGDLLQSIEMKRHGEVDDYSPGKLRQLLAGMARRRYLILAVVFMAVSFFAFLKLLSLADLSFAVPVTAASVVVETILARVLLKETVGGLRWAGASLVACGVALLAF